MAKKKRPSKHDVPIKIDATPEKILKTVFMGRPKPKDEWRYLKRPKTAG
ncbi:MAG: hypothetical protein OXH11_04485 [Candidatus Aminicenantes bacterium]|nr:hypothetical protein [Candidatus Aminicenantes bacterium]